MTNSVKVMLVRDDLVTYSTERDSYWQAAKAVFEQVHRDRNNLGVPRLIIFSSEGINEYPNFEYFSYNEVVRDFKNGFIQPTEEDIERDHIQAKALNESGNHAWERDQKLNEHSIE